MATTCLTHAQDRNVRLVAGTTRCVCVPAGGGNEKRQRENTLPLAEIFPAKFGYDLTRSRDQQDREVLDAMSQCSPINYVSADDPPVFVFHKAPQRISSTNHPPVPETINDPHSYWHGVLLADSLENAGVTVQRHIGPDVGKDETNAVRVAAFIIDHLCAKEKQ